MSYESGISGSLEYSRSLPEKSFLDIYLQLKDGQPEHTAFSIRGKILEQNLRDLSLRINQETTILVLKNRYRLFYIGNKTDTGREAADAMSNVIGQENIELHFHSHALDDRLVTPSPADFEAYDPRIKLHGLSTGGELLTYALPPHLQGIDGITIKMVDEAMQRRNMTSTDPFEVLKKNPKLFMELFTTAVPGAFNYGPAEIMKLMNP